MATTALTLQEQAVGLQRDLKEQIESFFESLPELNSLVSMGTALVEQAKAITVFQRDQRGQITVSDGAAFIKATEQVQALKSVVEQMEELYEPFAAGLFKAHRTVTGLRAGNVAELNGEIKRLKLEREQYAAEEDRKARQAAQAAAEEARKAEETRLIEEARIAAAEGNSAQAEAILEEACTVEAPPAVVQSTVPIAQGLSFRSTWEWALLDVKKLKPEYLLVNEKAINALVRTQHKATEAMVGVGAIAVSERKIPVDR
jgi:hypothetical protein